MKNEKQKYQTKRNREIYERRLAGETLKKLSKEFDLSPERIRVIAIQEERRLKFQERTRRWITGGYRPLDMNDPGRGAWMYWDLVFQQLEFKWNRNE